MDTGGKGSQAGWSSWGTQLSTVFSATLTEGRGAQNLEWRKGSLDSEPETADHRAANSRKPLIILDPEHKRSSDLFHQRGKEPQACLRNREEKFQQLLWLKFQIHNPAPNPLVKREN